MGADAAARRENAFGGDHAAQIFGRGFDANEQDLLALGRGLDSAVRVEIDLAAGRARAGGQAAGDDFRRLHGSAIEDGGEHLLELVGGIAQDRRSPSR